MAGTMQFQRENGFIETREQIGGTQQSRVFRAVHSAYTVDLALKITTHERVSYVPRPHAAIVPVVDTWQDAHNAYLLMPLYASDARRTPPTKEQVPVWIRTIAEALAHVHSEGFVHQDVKPENFLLDEKGSLVLADFSIAVPIGTVGAPPANPLYAAPEQLLGQAVSAATDVYALGIVLHEWLSGAHPLAHLSAKVALMRQLHDPLPMFAHPLNYLIQTMTRKVASERVGLGEVMK
jgi:serine/threonine protein kinase